MKLKTRNVMEFRGSSGFFLCIFTVLAQGSTDIAPGIYCNKKMQTWFGARADCLNAGGKFVAYNTGIGVDLPSIQLNREADVWTADYAYISTASGSYKYEELCGFHYLAKSILHLQEFFGDCYTKRKYFCHNQSTSSFSIFVEERHNILCNDVFSLNQLYNFIEPGYYWTTNIHQVIKDQATNRTSPTQKPLLCGAFSDAIGKYFEECTSRKLSLCEISKGQDDTFDKSCFDSQFGYSTSGKPTTKYTTILSSVNHTPTFTQTDASQFANVETTVMKRTTKAVLQQSLLNNTTSSHVDGEIAGRSGNIKDRATLIGLTVGIGIAFIGGVLLSIYIVRRIKCLKTKDRESDSKHASMTNGLNRENRSDQITDHSASNERTAKLNKSIPEYAVICKKYPKPTAHWQQELSARQTHGPISEQELNEAKFVCSAKYEHTDVSVYSKNIQTSEYSFTKEIEGREEECVIVREDVYDVTGNEQKFQTSNNIYDKFQTSNRDQSGNVKRAINPDNVLEDAYDSTEHIAYSRQTDNIYNHLSADETYSHATHRMQHSKVTDHIYS